MKFILSMIMCSTVANTCLAPHTFENYYDDSFSCLIDGYQKSLDKINEIGKIQINEHKIFVKFECHEIVLPKPKPKIENKTLT